MRIELNTTELKKALENVIRVTPKKTGLNILKEVCFKVDDKSTLKLIATDLETSMTAEIMAIFNDKIDGSFVIEDISRLVKALKFFKADITTFEVTDEYITIKNDNKKVVSQLLDSEEYPELIDLKTLDIKNEYIYSADKLNNRIKLVSYAVSKSDNRPLLQGVHFNGNDMVAIDGYRCALNADADLSINIPFTMMLNSLKQLTVFKGESIKITEYDKYIVFSDEQYTLLTRKIDGDYFKHEHLFEASAEYSFKPDIKQMVEGLIYLKTMHKSVGTCTAEFKGNSIQGIGSKAIFTLDSITPYDKYICFNCEYMIEALKQFDNDVSIGITGKTSPIILTDENGQNKAVVLPFYAK